MSPSLKRSAGGQSGGHAAGRLRDGCGTAPGRLRESSARPRCPAPRCSRRQLAVEDGASHGAALPQPFKERPTRFGAAPPSGGEAGGAGWGCSLRSQPRAPEASRFSPQTDVIELRGRGRSREEGEHGASAEQPIPGTEQPRAGTRRGRGTRDAQTAPTLGRPPKNQCRGGAGLTPRNSAVGAGAAPHAELWGGLGKRRELIPIPNAMCGGMVSPWAGVGSGVG